MEPQVSPQPSNLKGWTQAIYALHAFSLIVGIVGAATVVGAFLFGWPSILAVILNYVKRSEARGTWLESHFRWQIRTFWFGLLWAIPGFFFIITIIGWFIGMFILMVDATWIIYRVVKGWLRLNDEKQMYVKA